MSHVNHAHESNTKKIWLVFGILSVVTIVEVYLGIIRPDFLVLNDFLSMSLLNWVFIVLTIYKAYKITWVFMHMEAETASMQWAVVSTLVFLICYLLFILLVEGNYIHDVFRDSTIKWNF